MPGIGSGGHKKMTVNDFVTLVVIEFVVFLVSPTFGLFFNCRSHGSKLSLNLDRVKLQSYCNFQTRRFNVAATHAATTGFDARFHNGQAQPNAAGFAVA